MVQMPRPVAELSSVIRAEAPLRPKDRTEKKKVSVLYLSSPENAAVSTLTTLRNCKISTLLVYTPHHSADFAFRVGTKVGRQKFAEAEWAFNWPHLRQFRGAKPAMPVLGTKATKIDFSAPECSAKARTAPGTVGQKLEYNRSHLCRIGKRAKGPARCPAGKRRLDVARSSRPPRSRPRQALLDRLIGLSSQSAGQ